jgi:hypothetical protein
MKRKTLLISIPIILLIGTLVIFGSKLQEKFFPPKPINLVEEQPVTCAKDDTACIGAHAKNLTHQLSGINVEFAKNQCNGPHACPTPRPEDITAATASIRTYTKDATLQVVPINGVMSNGTIYYCAKNNQCWTLEAKSNKVLSKVQPQPTPTPIQPKNKTYGKESN